MSYATYVRKKEHMETFALSGCLKTQWVVMYGRECGSIEYCDINGSVYAAGIYGSDYNDKVTENFTCLINPHKSNMFTFTQEIDSMRRSNLQDVTKQSRLNRAKLSRIVLEFTFPQDYIRVMHTRYIPIQHATALCSP